jgi:hypothetical protein
VEEACRRAIRKGQKDQVSYRFLKTKLEGEFDEDQLVEHKADIKQWAGDILVSLPNAFQVEC